MFKSTGSMTSSRPISGFVVSRFTPKLGLSDRASSSLRSNSTLHIPNTYCPSISQRFFPAWLSCDYQQANVILISHTFTPTTTDDR